MLRSFLALGALGVTRFAVSACSDDDALVPELSATALLSVVPAGGSTNVDPAQPVVLEFDGAMMPGMEKYALLHEGDVTGASVAGAWSWSDDYRRLTFTPAQPLKSATKYTVHLGGGMMAADGKPADLQMHGQPHMGGQWVTEQMMARGSSGGGMTGVTQTHLGSGWQQGNRPFAQ